MILTFTTNNREKWSDSQGRIFALQRMVELCNLERDRPVLSLRYSNTSGKSGIQMLLESLVTWTLPEEFDNAIIHRIEFNGEEPYLTHFTVTIKALFDSFREN